MLFYLDPPYFGSEGDYGKAAFDRDQYGEMAERLAGIKGRFILSINDRPEVRSIFHGFEAESVEATYTISAGAPGRFCEMIITGPSKGV